MKIKYPSKIIYGENDTTGYGKEGAEILQNIPGSETVIFKNGSHPCYLDNPELWHKTLLSFIRSF